MPGKKFSSEQIITKLQEAEVLLSQGIRVNEAARKLEISEQTTTAGARNLGDWIPLRLGK